jgi:hypothetical protein
LPAKSAGGKADYKPIVFVILKAPTDDCVNWRDSSENELIRSKGKADDIGAEGLGDLELCLIAE